MLDSKVHIRIIIKQVFGEYFSKNSFKEFYEHDWIISFKNEKSIFRFTKNYSDVDLNISSALKDNCEYNIKVIYITLHNKGIELLDQFTKGEDDRLKRQLSGYLDFLTKDLPDLPNGDFSWSKEYNAYTEKEKTIFTKLWSLDVNHPIYQKFKKGDISWRNDILLMLK